MYVFANNDIIFVQSKLFISSLSINSRLYDILVKQLLELNLVLYFIALEETVQMVEILNVLPLSYRNPLSAD